MSIKIIIVEDQRTILDAFELLLNAVREFEVMATFADSYEALSWAKGNSVDMVLSDVEMPNFSGLEMAEAIRKCKPETKIVMLTTFAKIGYLEKALDIGVDGYLTKDMPLRELIESMMAIYQGQAIIAKDLRVGVQLNPNPLTVREKDILRLVSFGLSNKDISVELHLSTGTVRNYLSMAMEKLNANSRTEALKYALDNGWI
ncbi:response regulator transcription factor [Microbulbifer sp. 2201CG32-9]|uniref:response regulator transcription factor n=1 Tax=Microbulbifer sp. 2201CG32-9 TaxID=3232309 RepID=UPI00345BAAE1